jgi:predicted dehydrogenase
VSTGHRSDVRLGFIGAGGIVQRALAPAVAAADGVVLQAVAARSRERAEALQPAGRAYDDYAALLADPSVDLVYVALDNGGHLPWTLAALEAGKHVVCEKPIALDPASLETMIKASVKSGKLLVEAFWYRWHPRTRRLEQLLAQGALGPVRRVASDFTFFSAPDGDLARNYRLDPGRGGGGIYDVGCYAVSAAHLALGPSLTVAAASARRGPTGVDVEAGASLFGTSPRRDDGRPVAEVRCGISGSPAQVIEVAGQAATVAFGEPAFTALHRPVEMTITTPDRAVRREYFAPVDPYRLMVEAVAARVRGEQAFLPGLEHSRAVAATTAAWFAAL